MLKLCIFIIFSILSQTFGLVENLFRTQNDCYSKCDLKNRVTSFNVDACKKGCDYKLHNGNCANKCRSLSIDQQIQTSCLNGCLSINSQSIVPIDNQALRSIILIRLRQRPSPEPTSMNINFMSMLMNMTKQLNEKKNWIKQTNKTPSPVSNDERILEVKNPIYYDTEQVKQTNTESKKFLNSVQNQWNNFARKYPMIYTWLWLSYVLVFCTFILYKTVSICRRMPTFQTLSVHTEKLAIDNIYEKEELSSNKKEYQYKESMPIKY